MRLGAAAARESQRGRSQAPMGVHWGGEEALLALEGRDDGAVVDLAVRARLAGRDASDMVGRGGRSRGGGWCRGARC